MNPAQPLLRQPRLAPVLPCNGWLVPQLLKQTGQHGCNAIDLANLGNDLPGKLGMKAADALATQGKVSRRKSLALNELENYPIDYRA